MEDLDKAFDKKFKHQGLMVLNVKKEILIFIRQREKKLLKFSNSEIETLLTCLSHFGKDSEDSCVQGEEFDKQASKLYGKVHKFRKIGTIR